MLAFRFANGMFEPIWNRNYIDYVQITAAEDLGIGTRAGYYDTSGALRDLVAEPHAPAAHARSAWSRRSTFTADEVRDEKVKVLHAIKPPLAEEVPERVVRAQYGPGVAEGKEVPGYLEEEGVPPRLARPRPTWRCGSRSTTGAGRACRSTCAPASGWPARSPRSP